MVSVCFLISETDVGTVVVDLPSSRDGCISHHSDVVPLHKPIRMMPVPSALHYTPKMTTNVPVDNRGYLIVSIKVVYWCQFTTACHSVVNCFQAYTAKAESGTDISMQNVALIIRSPKGFSLEQQQPVSQLQEKDSMTLAICRSFSCLQSGFSVSRRY